MTENTRIAKQHVADRIGFNWEEELKDILPGKSMSATREQDREEKWDFFHPEVGHCSVKGPPKAARNDGKRNFDFIWVELVDVNGYPGACSAPKVDTMAYRMKDEFLVFDQSVLRTAIVNRIIWNYSVKAVPWNLKSRYQRSDLIIWVPVDAIAHLAILRIPAKTISDEVTVKP